MSSRSVRLAWTVSAMAWVAAGAQAWALESWLRAPTFPSSSTTASIDAASTDAALQDVLLCYRSALQVPGSETALAAALARSQSTLRRSRGDAEDDLGTPAARDSAAALLLCLRAREEIALRLGRPAPGLEAAARAESLETALRVAIDDLRAGPETLWPLCAGLRPTLAEHDHVVPALYEMWRRLWFEPPAGAHASLEFFLFHRLASEDARVLDDVQARPPRDASEATLVELAQMLRSDRLQPFVADDAGRRLALSVNALTTAGVLPAWAAGAARRASVGTGEPEPRAYARACAAIDSLRALLEAAPVGAAGVHGSRLDYYVRAGESSPGLAPAVGSAARDLGLRALRSLRARHGRRVLQRLGACAVAELDPVEIVPGQQVAAEWSFSSAQPLRPAAWRARIGDIEVAVPVPPAELPAAGAAALRTSFAPLPEAAAGATLAPWLQVRFELEGWGTLEIEDRVPVRVVAPLQATLLPIGGALVCGDQKSVEVCITSRSPAPLAGEFRVVATSDWRVRPARAFRYELRRPGQSARQQLDLSLPAYASPGEYEVVVQLAAAERSLGTLHARLVKPLQWVVVGPFAPPPPRQPLLPEVGVNVQARYAGLDDRQIAWQVAPAEVYDVDGSLDLEALYPDLREPACACALTVLESTESGAGSLRVAGAARVRWNGAAPARGDEVRIERGRNVLLVRACAGSEGWRVRAELRDTHGEVLRVVANDLPRLVDGYASLGKAVPRAVTQLVDRIVTLRFRGAGARQVSVLGAFNAWVPLGLERQPDGMWQRELRLPPGRYAYKLMVDGRLRPDPEAPGSEPDGFGGRNSLLIVR